MKNYRVHPTHWLISTQVAAPRTGRGLMPGEEVEIVERVVVDDAKGGRTFLRLADGGWAMERHPSSGVPILRVSSGDSV